METGWRATPTATRSNRTVVTRSSPCARSRRARATSTRRIPSPLLGCDVGGGDAAVDCERRAGDVARLVARQEERRVDHLAGLGQAAHRPVHAPALERGG